MLSLLIFLLGFFLGTESEKCTLLDENTIPGWTVGIYSPHRNIVLCTGTLIAPRVVLTSGFCGVFVSNPKEHIYLLSTHHEERNVPLRQDNVIIHPEFDGESKPWAYSMTIILMDHPFSNNVPYLCLPEQNQEFVGRHCVETGWGNEKGSGSNMRGELHNQMAEILNHPCPHKSLTSDPKQVEEELFEMETNGGVLCVGGYHYRGFCPGDDGATLACRNSHSNRYVLAGLLASGSKLQKCDKEIEDDSNFFTDISFHLEWLNRTIPQEYLDEAKGSARPTQLVSYLLLITCLLVSRISYYTR